MRKFYFIAALILALAAAPHLSAQQKVLPNHFGGWSCKPGAEYPEFDRIANFSALSKETGITANEFGDCVSGAAKIHMDLDKYRDPSSAYEMYTALIRPDMHPSTLDKTSAVDGDRLFVLVGSFILQLRPTTAISTADLVRLVYSVSDHVDQALLPLHRTYLTGR